MKVESFVAKKIESWINEVKELTTIAKCEPQLAYCAYVFGLSKRWMYVMRTINNISHLFKPLEDHIFSHFLPAIVNFQFSPHDRQIFSMPTKFGGLGIFDPSEISDFEYLYSLRATSPLTNVIAAQTLKLTGEDIVNLNKSIDDAKAAIKTSKMQHNKIKFDEIKDNSCQDLQHLLNQFSFNRSLTGSPLCLCLKSVESADHILHCEIASPVLLVARKSLQETCCELGVDFTIPMIINCRDKELLHALAAYLSEVLAIRSDFIDRDLRYFS